MSNAETLPNFDNFPATLRAWREAKGFSRAALGKASGLNESTLWRLEHGRTTPTLETACMIADAFAITLDQLVRGPR